MGRCFKPPQIGHRSSSAGVQGTVLMQLVQRVNQNRVDGGGWEMGIPQMEKECNLLGNILLAVRRRFSPPPGRYLTILVC